MFRKIFKRSNKKNQKKGWKQDVRVIAEGLLIALVIRSLILQPFTIPSGSMYPTLMVGDYLFVTKYSYGISRYSFPFGGDILPTMGRIFGESPKQGDVAVFRLVNKNVDYIKRVIGMPGDTVQMKQGRVFINGKILERKRLTDSKHNNRIVATYEETLPNGLKHKIWESQLDNGFADNTPEYTVPDGHYFMMGDNRDESQDSRFATVGYVPLEVFIGPARIIAFSLENGQSWKFWEWYSSGRGDRLGKVID